MSTSHPAAGSGLDPGHAVVLVAPKERSITDTGVWRDNSEQTDAENLALGPLMSSYVIRYRENLAINSLAAYLRDNGIQTVTVNGHMENLDTADAVDRILAEAPRLVGISLLYEHHIFGAISIVRALRARGYAGHITAGGSFVATAFEDLLAVVRGIDTVIRGEGETPLLALVRALETRRDWRDIPGIAFLAENGRAHANPGAAAVDLDTLPFAARDSLVALRGRGADVRVAAVYSSRGCRARCTFCTVPSTAALNGPERWRARDPIRLVDEVDRLVGELGIQYLYFCDTNFFGHTPTDRQRLREFAHEMIKRGHRVRFHAEVRVDAGLDVELLQLLGRAGLADVLLGIESGAPSVLKRWRKGASVEANRRAIETVRRSGLALEPALILVDPLTTPAEFAQTVAFIEQTAIHRDNIPMHLINPLKVFPGSQIERDLRAQQLLSIPDMSRYSAGLRNDEEVWRFCRDLAIRDYHFCHDAVRIGWDALVDEVNRITRLAEIEIPTLLASRRAAMTGTQSDRARARRALVSLVSSLGRWRRGLGDLILALLKATSEWMSAQDVSRGARTSLEATLRRIVSDYECKTMGGPLDERLASARP